MGLKFYHDSGATNPIAVGDEDYHRGAVVSGNDLVSEKVIYIGSDETLLTYENVSVTSINDEDGASVNGDINVQYAVDSGGVAGTYQDTLPLSDGDFATAVPIWRKVIAPNVSAPFKRIDIEHNVSFDKYVK